MASAADPTLWQDANTTTPPEQWQAVDADGRWWWTSANAPNPITYIGANPWPGVLEFDWEIVTPPDAELIFYYSLEGVGGNEISLGTQVGSGTVEIDTTGAVVGGAFSFGIRSTYGESAYEGAAALLGPAIPAAAAAPFNCECADEHIDRTLAELRVSLLRRLGFSAQALNPPPGMAELLNDFLRDAQQQLYRRYATLRTERFFRWAMIPGTRFYGIRGDDNEAACDLRLDPYKITWAGVEDLHAAWMPLICGIPPTLYTSVAQLGIPSRYEVRQCIEVFPAPDQAYTLRVKGHFGLQPLIADTDQTTIDSEAVFLLALAQAKAHYRQPDAGNYFGQANSYIGALVSGSHLTRRYVPRARELAPLTRPRMVSWDDEP